MGSNQVIPALLLGTPVTRSGLKCLVKIQLLPVLEGGRGRRLPFVRRRLEIPITVEHKNRRGEGRAPYPRQTGSILDDGGRIPRVDQSPDTLFANDGMLASLLYTDWHLYNSHHSLFLRRTEESQGKLS